MIEYNEEYETYINEEDRVMIAGDDWEEQL